MILVPVSVRFCFWKQELNQTRAEITANKDKIWKKNLANLITFKMSLIQKV